MLGVSRNDGTKYRILGEDEEPMRVDARLGPDLAEWPVQTGTNSLVPDLDDVATRALAFHVVRMARGEERWAPSPVVHDPPIVEWVIERPSAVRQTLYPSANDAILGAWARL